MTHDSTSTRLCWWRRCTNVHHWCWIPTRRTCCASDIDTVEVHDVQRSVLRPQHTLSLSVGWQCCVSLSRCSVMKYVVGYRNSRHYPFLADRTNGRAYATVLRLSVCLSVVCRRRLSVTLCIVAKRCVLEQKLLLRAYRKSYLLWEIDWYQNEWPWPLFRGHIKVTSTIALH